MTDEVLRKISISSIVSAKEKKHNRHQATTLNEEEIKATLLETATQLTNARGMMELFPDLKFIMNLKTSTILSPRDFLFGGLILTLDPDIIDNNEKTNEALRLLVKHIRTHTTMEEDIPGYINEALFMYGADIRMYIPPSTLDTYLATGEFTMESLTNGDNDLKLTSKIETDTPSEKLSALGIDFFSNNPNLARMSDIRESLDNSNTEITMESYGFQGSANGRSKVLDRMDAMLASDAREDKGNAIEFKIPKDCVLVNHSPSDPSRHINYVVLIDEHGSIVTQSKDSNYYEQLEQRLNTALNTKSTEEYNTLKAMNMSGGLENKSSTKIVEMYTIEVEREIRKAVKKSTSRDTFELADHESFYRLMLARKLSNRKTRMLIVPAHMIDYMAFNYDVNGQGLSLLEETKLYASLRAVLMFSDLILQLDNNIPASLLTIDLDEHEKDPLGITHTLVQEFGRTVEQKIPSGTFNPSIIMDELRKSGIRVQVNGGSKFPGTKLSVESEQKSAPTIDETLKEQYQQQHYVGLNVQPEIVNRGLQGDFAIDTVLNNQMFVNAAMVDQYKFKKLLEKRILKYTLLSNGIYGELAHVVGEDITRFLRGIRVSLPKADTVSMEQQMEAYSAYSDGIQRMIEETQISDSLLRGIIEADVPAEILEEMRQQFTAHLLRKYVRNENIIPELIALTEVDNNGNSAADEMLEHNDKLIDVVGKFVKGMIAKDAKLQVMIDKARTKADDVIEAGGEDEDTVVDNDLPSPEEDDVDVVDLDDDVVDDPDDIIDDEA